MALVSLGAHFWPAYVFYVHSKHDRAVSALRGSEGRWRAPEGRQGEGRVRNLRGEGTKITVRLTPHGALWPVKSDGHRALWYSLVPAGPVAVVILVPLVGMVAGRKARWIAKEIVRSAPPGALGCPGRVPAEPAGEEEGSRGRPRRVGRAAGGHRTVWRHVAGRERGAVPPGRYEAGHAARAGPHPTPGSSWWTPPGSRWASSTPTSASRPWRSSCWTGGTPRWGRWPGTAFGTG
ncbi:hypothetical protein [Actinomadura sp. NBRC 104412]|uniref:hypothetical protein n=1 Tax=Actinomadura sp. NBRC 104412 TaxID=3032203 RepID=UPI002553A927|nr:hypothetical protein [Actinomadura sp. NBRC 104412]